jgi:thymidine kinase
MSGYLEMIIGPMFSGKTSRILEIYRKAKYCNTNVFVINHSIDNRYSTDKVVNHNNESIPCTNYNMLSDFIEFLKKKENDYLKNSETIILINEAQFFKDIKRCVINLVEDFNFKVYLCGLDGDFKRNQFGDFLELIPYSNKITKLNSLCFKCKNGNEAPFTYRYNNNNNNKQIMVGSNESYIPLCRSCYLTSIIG